ncbi:hypothetical protein GW17_00039030 [Ensete ventricosum]|nr:hypothetical protein GW17_00039030 [Ensete ventricosum]
MRVHVTPETFHGPFANSSSNDEGSLYPLNSVLRPRYANIKDYIRFKQIGTFPPLDFEKHESREQWDPHVKLLLEEIGAVSNTKFSE